ncbi:hypothetical protein PO124_13725 [Bacillus licheniformis]|nr:hypothetical protein [Bacillus licheniformis]
MKTTKENKTNAARRNHCRCRFNYWRIHGLPVHREIPNGYVGVVYSPNGGVNRKRWIKAGI